MIIPSLFLRQLTTQCNRRMVLHRLRTASSSASTMNAPRYFTADATAAEAEVSSKKTDEPLSSSKLQSLYDEIIKLPEEEVNILGALVIQVLGRTIYPGEFGGGGMAVEAGSTEAEEVVETKTAFDLKLVGFDAKAKIKVIKEVRAIAGLGLKEAKELVDSAPKVIQKSLKEDKAEELKAALEAVGAQIEIV